MFTILQNLPRLIVRNLHLISNLTDQILPEKLDKNEIRLDDENIAFFSSFGARESGFIPILLLFSKSQNSCLVETPRLIYLVFLSLHTLIFKGNSPFFQGFVLVTNHINCYHLG